MTDYAGIDYGHGMANVDHETGIRFGVINQGEVIQAWADSSEMIYPDPACPDCGHESDKYECPDHGNFEEAWENCCVEAIGSVYEEEGYKATQSDDDGDIFIEKSPFYTRAQFCSPCAPGAGYLMNPCPDGPKTYCFGHDWFEDEKAPYPVYRVENDEEVLP
jgi:hypothetical protein